MTAAPSTSNCVTSSGYVTAADGLHCARCDAVIPRNGKVFTHVGKHHPGYGPAFSNQLLCADCIEHVCPMIVPRARR